MKLTPTQKLVLADLKRIARKSRSGRFICFTRIKHLRFVVINNLINKGLVEFTDSGLRLPEVQA